MNDRLIKSSLQFCVFALFLTVNAGVSAQESRAYLHSYNLPGHGVAIEGYSPVSYFTAGKAVQGSKNIAVDHDGVTYYLSSTTERQQFAADPDR